MEITRQEEDKQGYSSTVKFECKTWIQWGIYIELTGHASKMLNNVLIPRLKWQHFKCFEKLLATLLYLSKYFTNANDKTSISAKDKHN